MQWADQGSIALLHYLLRHLGAERVLLLGTYREVMEIFPATVVAR